MTPERYSLAVLIFHVVVLGAALITVSPFREQRICALPLRHWMATLVRRVSVLAVFAYAVSLLATVTANLADLDRLRVGSISGRLMGQALFGEGIVISVILAVRHRRAAQGGRTTALALIAAGLFTVYVDAYHIEPRLLRVRHHVVSGESTGAALRILHLTDIQTPVIGAHEERALRAGLDTRPDLIVLTGDYVQDALGRPTEAQAAHDLRELMKRIGFDAPLGVFATEGDVGPPCREVFAGTNVQCLTDASARVVLPDGKTLGITGLSRTRGRERRAAWLAGLLGAAPSADHRIVISHAPDFVDALPVKVDLVLAGHTHGGQVVLPLFGPPQTAMRLPRRYAGGLHDYFGQPLHVSRGIGMERGFTVPVRFFCPPEVCVLDLRLPSEASRPGASPASVSSGPLPPG